MLVKRLPRPRVVAKGYLQKKKRTSDLLGFKNWDWMPHAL
jgi:hypothetical protein